MITPYKGRTLEEGDTVEVYRNLHKGGYSIKKAGVVVAHADYVDLVNVRTVINESGRQKVIKEQRKNVHARLVGTYVHTLSGLFAVVKPRMMTYNPYKYSQFIDVDTQEFVTSARAVRCTGGIAVYAP